MTEANFGRNFSWNVHFSEGENAQVLAQWLSARYDECTDVLGREDWRRLCRIIAREVLPMAFRDRVVLPRSFQEQRTPKLPLDAVELLDRAFREFMNAVHTPAIMEARPHTAKNRLFISHRQIDSELGKRVACIAQEHRYAYWLDVHDPLLNALSAHGARLPPQVVAVLTAAIIEIALINCSHVIALISRHARGSMWIPYELGRAKNSRSVWSLEAASWIWVGARRIPEYLHLAPIFRKEQEIRKWLGGAASTMPCRRQTQHACLDSAR